MFLPSHGSATTTNNFPTCDKLSAAIRVADTSDLYQVKSESNALFNISDKIEKRVCSWQYGTSSPAASTGHFRKTTWAHVKETRGESRQSNPFFLAASPIIWINDECPRVERTTSPLIPEPQRDLTKPSKTKNACKAPQRVQQGLQNKSLSSLRPSTACWAEGYNFIAFHVIDSNKAPALFPD